MRRWLLVVWLVGWGVAAHAAPTVTVRARTRLQIETVHRTTVGVRVIGKLLEIGTGTGVPDKLVRLRIEGQELTTRTAGTGRFEAEFFLAQGAYELSARFGGDTEYDESSLENFRFDVGKETLSLSVRARTTVEPGEPGLEVTVEATTPSGPQAVTVTVHAGDLGGALRAVERAETDAATGKGSVLVSRTLLGQPGEKRLRVEFPGNDAFNPASAETTFRVMTTTSIEDFRLPRDPVKYESAVVAVGRLVGDRGEGVPDASVALMASGRRVGGAVTDDDGAFRIKVKASEFSPGRVTLAAEYQSSTPWRRGTRGAPGTVTILEPQPVPIGYTIGAFAATAGVLLGFVLARTRPWLPLVERWQRRRRRPDLATPPAGEAALAPPETGLKLARPGLMSTLRRAADLGMSGVVRDVLSGAHVGGARVTMSHETHAAVAAAADERGRFELVRLEPGVWRVEVSAHGYVTERFTASFPHRGELRDVRVDLLPVRERIFSIYRDVAAPLLPRRELWGVWTPRELLDHVRQKRPAGALGQLTDFVEETCFSPRVPDESILSVAIARAREASGEPGAVPPAPAPPSR